MSEETNQQLSPAETLKAVTIKRLTEDRDRLTGAIVAGFNRQHPGSFERNWSQDFSHENGMYENICCMCTKHFLGYKRRVVCKVCSNSAPKETECSTSSTSSAT